jgi:MFS family permease
MFWPIMNALIQELTPESEFVHANSFLIAGLQGGWLIAGAVVGFVYNQIGLGGILFIDVTSYLLSFTCYLFVRKGRHTVAVPATQPLDKGAVGKFFHELHEGLAYIRLRPRLLLLGIAWALFVGAMLSQGIISAPLSDRILKTGAVGYGWLNGGWAIGAFTGAFLTPWMIRMIGLRHAVSVSMAILGLSLISLPFAAAHLHGWIYVISLALMVCVAIYSIMGCCRALGGVAITSSMMEMVPKHFMGRVQNTFYFAGTCLQFVLSLIVGTVAHNKSLALAFAMVGALYLLACVAGSWPSREVAPDAVPVVIPKRSEGTL